MATDYKEALQQIVALKEKELQPPVSTIGHRDSRVELYEKAIKIATKALE